MFSFLCSHNYKYRGVARGENLIGSVTYALRFVCTRCGKRRYDAGYSRDGAFEEAEWYENQ